MRKTLGAIALLLLLTAGVVVNALRPSPSVKARDAVGMAVSSMDYVNRTSYINGEGPNIILMPSLGRQASDFNELSQSLKDRGYKSVSIDPSEDGGKMSDYAVYKTLETVTHSTKAASGANFYDKRSILIGHAFGNRVVRMAAHQNPENVSGVILLAAGGQVPMPPEAEQSLKNIFNPLRTYRSRMKDVRYAFFAEGNEIPSHWKRGWHTKTAMAQVKAVSNSADDESWHCAGGVPMLIIQPMQDRIAPIENAYALRDKCPQEVEIVEVQNAGHALLPEQPEAVAKAVLDFLAKHHPTNQNQQDTP